MLQVTTMQCFVTIICLDQKTIGINIFTLLVGMWNVKRRDLKVRKFAKGIIIFKGWKRICIRILRTRLILVTWQTHHLVLARFSAWLVSRDMIDLLSFSSTTQTGGYLPLCRWFPPGVLGFGRLLTLKTWQTHLISTTWTAVVVW